jgi:hypothetical protein
MEAIAAGIIGFLFGAGIMGPVAYQHYAREARI